MPKSVALKLCLRGPGERGTLIRIPVISQYLRSRSFSLKMPVKNPPVRERRIAGK
ncbi:MAG: hypothetical protein LBI20_01590 [Holosporales bacterium]|jgi:hypothetical protein|nr:hypothetical protein [Holosporales bacterium]